MLAASSPAFAQPAEPAAPAAPAEVAPDRAAVAADGYPLAGRHGRYFYVRDPSDRFRLFVTARTHLDAYGYFGPGVSHTPLQPTMFIRRFRLQLAGEFFHDLFFMLQGEFGRTGLDNPRGTNESSAAPPGIDPAADTGRYLPAQTPLYTAAPSDIFVGYRAHPLASVQVGQFNVPFTLENRTMNTYVPLMERSLAVRVVGAPTTQDIGLMLWGETSSKLLYYSVGVFNGEGPNRPNVDGTFDVAARAFVHPLASRTDELADVQLGASVRRGVRSSEFVNYDYPAMTTQGGFAFWTPVYAGTDGFTRILPAGRQLAYAGELRVPVGPFVATSEAVVIDNRTREAREGMQATATERAGDLQGWCYYAELGYWIGERDLPGRPGYMNPPHIDFGKPDPAALPRAVQLVARWEQLRLDYDSASRSGAPDPAGVDGDIKVDAFSLGASLWVTTTLRLSINYVLDHFPDSAPLSPSAPGGPTQTSDQRALAPGNTLRAGVDDDARDTAHSLHELGLRLSLHF